MTHAGLLHRCKTDRMSPTTARTGGEEFKRKRRKGMEKREMSGETEGKMMGERKQHQCRGLGLNLI